MISRRFYVTRRDSKRKPTLYEGRLLVLSGKTISTLHKQWDKKKNVIKETPEKKKYATDAAFVAKVNELVAEWLADGYVEVDEKGYDIESKKLRPKIGRYIDQVIAKVDSSKRRENLEPTNIAWQKASKKAAPDARELLDACAVRAYQCIFIGDYVMTEDDHAIPNGGYIKLPRSTPKNWIIFGQSQQGDLYMIDVKPGKATRVMRMLEKEKWRAVEEAKSLDEFFKKVVRQAKKDKERSDLDPPEPDPRLKKKKKKRSR